MAGIVSISVVTDCGFEFGPLEVDITAWLHEQYFASPLDRLKRAINWMNCVGESIGGEISPTYLWDAMQTNSFCIESGLTDQVKEYFRIANNDGFLYAENAGLRG